MLQIDTRHYASDALEDAMRLAQIKALNSFTFSDCLNFLNYAWSDIYSRMAMIDDGYYGTNMQITSKLTKLPPFVKSTVQIYSAQSPTGFDRVTFRDAGTSELTSSNMYRISGTDLYCPDAERKKVWLYFVPQPKQLFFTHHNRDPKLYEEYETKRNDIYGYFKVRGLYKDDNDITQALDITTATREELSKVTTWQVQHRGTFDVEDITEYIAAAPLDDESDGEWKVVYLSCDYPYIFITYEQSLTGEHISGFLDKDRQFNKYNPFAFTGRNSNVEYIDCHWNDKTGLAAVIIDYNDTYQRKDADGDTVTANRIKELGWTPDTQLDYPIPEMYRYLVARLADKFSALNESNVMGVQKELVEARFAFEAFLDRDKSAWKRIENVNIATVGDWL